MGILSLAKGHLTYTAHGQGALSSGHCRKLGRHCGQPDLAQGLGDEEGVRIFDEPVDALRFSFPWLYFGGGMKVHTSEACFRLSFLRPANTMASIEAGILSGNSILRGRKAGRRWRELLTGSPAAGN